MTTTAQPASAEAASAASASTGGTIDERFQRRNLTLFIIASGLFGFGWSMPGVIQAPYLNWLGLSNSTIAFVASSSSLALIGMFFSPWISRRFQRKKALRFFLALPYFACCMGVGVSIWIAQATGNRSWLATTSIICFVLWPLASGWGIVPSHEFVANCISKKRIGIYVGFAQSSGSILSVLGAACMTYLVTLFGVPARYAIAYMLAASLASLSAVMGLFAHETPSPPPPREPFWRPAYDALLHDRIFRRLLCIVAMFGLTMGFPAVFIPLLAIREWGMPDWVASGCAITNTAATATGALLATWLSQRTGYVRAMLICMAIAPLSMIPLIWPRSSEMMEDTYRGSWTIARSASDPTASSNSHPRTFSVVAHDPSGRISGRVEHVAVEFNRPVNPASFTINDVQIRNPQRQRIDLARVTPDAAKQLWTIEPASPLTQPGQYELLILPYIRDATDQPLDQNQNGSRPRDEVRFFIAMALFGIAYLGVPVVLRSLMYLLAPDNRRAGYFAAFQIVQIGAINAAVALSGVAFKPGTYVTMFGAALVAMVTSLFLAIRLAKPLERPV